jgi:hypothetical protein
LEYLPNFDQDAQDVIDVYPSLPILRGGKNV